MGRRKKVEFRPETRLEDNITIKIHYENLLQKAKEASALIPYYKKEIETINREIEKLRKP